MSWSKKELLCTISVGVAFFIYGLINYYINRK